MLSVSAWLPLLVPALGAVLAYAYNRRQAVLQRRTTLYADALAAMDKLQQGPYRIRVRTSDAPEHRQALVDLVRSVQESLSHYEFLLRLDSPKVSRAFTRLVMDAREVSVAERDRAWHAPLADGPDKMEPRYWIEFDNQFLWHACIAEMRRELRMVPRLRAEVDPRTAIDAERSMRRCTGQDGTTFGLAVHVERPRRRPLRRRPSPRAWVRVTWLSGLDRRSWESDWCSSAAAAHKKAVEWRSLLETHGADALPPASRTSEEMTAATAASVIPPLRPTAPRGQGRRAG